MNIVCEKCATVYRIDPSRIPRQGKKVKCSKCGHIFIARAPADEDDVPTTEQEADFSAELSEDVHNLETEPTDPGRGKAPEATPRRLLLRQDGTRYAVSDLATLQRWIVERRVSRDAELSEDGEVWERVGERMDLLPFFGIVERTRKRRDTRTRAGAAGRAGHRRDRPARAAVDKSEEPTVVERRPGVTASEDADRGGPREPGSTEASRAKVDLHAMKTVAADAGGGPRATPESAGDQPLPLERESKEAPVADIPEGSPLKLLVAIVIILTLVVLAFGLKVRYIDKVGSTRPVASLSPTPAGRISAPAQPKGPTAPPGKTHPSRKPPSPQGAPSSPGKHAPAPETSPAPTRPTPPAGGVEKPAPTPRTEEASEPAAPPTTPKPASHPATPKPARQPATPKPARLGTSTSSTQPAKPKPAPSSTTTAGASASRWIAIGQSRIRAHRYDDAVDAFRNAVTKSPSSARAHKELGLGLLNLADIRYGRRNALLQEAADEFKKAVTLDGGYAEAYHLLGVTYMQLDRKAEAAANFRLALQHGLKGDDATEARVFLQKLVDELEADTAVP